MWNARALPSMAAERPKMTRLKAEGIMVQHPVPGSVAESHVLSQG